MCYYCQYNNKCAWPSPRPHWLQSFQGDWSQAKAMCMVGPKATPPLRTGAGKGHVPVRSLWDPYPSLPIHSHCHWAVQHGMLRPWLQQILFTSIHYCIGKQAHLLDHLSQDWDSKPQTTNPVYGVTHWAVQLGVLSPLLLLSPLETGNGGRPPSTSLIAVFLDRWIICRGMEYCMRHIPNQSQWISQ